MKSMCRNIRPLFNFEPPATEEEIKDASLQFIRKISGFSKPSKVNTEPFNLAVTETSKIISDLLNSLQTRAKPKNREEEKAKREAINAKRFGTRKD